MRGTLAAGVLLVLACESRAPPSSTVRARSGPTQFDGRSAGLYLIPSRYNGTPVTEMVLLVHEGAVPCEPSDLPVSRKLLLSAVRIPPHVLGPGEYRSEAVDGLAPVEWLAGQYQEVRAACGLTLHLDGALLTLSSLDVGGAEGTLETRLEDGTDLAGAFTAPACPVVMSAVSGANEALPTCGLQ
jgi:hypothetical protein